MPAQLSWAVADGGAACDPAIIDGQGDLSVAWLNGNGITTSYLRADGSAAAAIRDGKDGTGKPVEGQIAEVPRTSGFLVLSKTFTPWCNFVRPIASDANPTGPAVFVEAAFPNKLQQIGQNPAGGYVEVRINSDGKQPATKTLDLRFVNEALLPLGDWQTALTYRENIQWAVNVDQQGRALVLAFMYPPSFGPPPPPADWRFSARWMGPNGPLTEEFQPVTPIFTPTSPSGFVVFAGWGTIVPLPEGGFAMYQYQTDPSYGTISPTGWYAFYPSRQAATESPPSWLQLYDGSLRLLANGQGYAAIEPQGPNSCARTVLLVAASGRTCFTLALEGADACNAFPDTLWPDGSLVLQNADGHSSCLISWWPGLARPAR
ncbi:MAG: hypothetical protein E6J78_20065 [Deltaproteobacteria bacterium]|nr:MAG: hypothetical protein E6J78_20065 [Deltaproteobacteria bacterium]